MGRARGQNQGSLQTLAHQRSGLDGFAAVFGETRGRGETRLDQDSPSVSARANMRRALDLARAGDMQAACDLLHEHRKSLDTPLVAQLQSELVTMICDSQLQQREEWLADFLHASVRDGRDGRVLRGQITSSSGPLCRDEMPVHLRPDAEVDTPPPYKNANGALCGATKHLQRAPIGAWDNASVTAGNRITYTRCPSCEERAELVAETANTHAGLLPTDEFQHLRTTHQADVSSKLSGLLQRRASPVSEKLEDCAAKSFPAAAIAAATRYVLHADDQRFDSIIGGPKGASSEIRLSGFSGSSENRLGAILGEEFIRKTLAARIPRRSRPANRGWGSAPTKQGPETWRARRERFQDALKYEFDLRSEPSA